MISKYKERLKYPCCGYPTLDEQGLYGVKGTVPMTHLFCQYKTAVTAIR
ncbi:MAG: hypothetical protein K0Q87_4016 [Neobacillus sp.]|jgi:hypothetical protein|nr:hypothetical protein [Neobacillus sp.]